MEQEKQPQLDTADAADVLLGDDPTQDWTPEQRAEVEEMLRALSPDPEPEPVNLQDHFKAGEIIKDPQGLRIAIRSIGQDCMNVSLLGGKKGKFVDNYQLNIGRFSFVTKMSRKKDTVFQLIGVLPQQENPDAEA